MAPKIDRVRIGGATYVETDGEADRTTVHANDMVVDVIANDDGTVYLELYAWHTRQRVGIVNLNETLTKGASLRLQLFPKGA